MVLHVGGLLPRINFAITGPLCTCAQKSGQKRNPLSPHLLCIWGSLTNHLLPPFFISSSFLHLISQISGLQRTSPPLPSSSSSLARGRKRKKGKEGGGLSPCPELLFALWLLYYRPFPSSFQHKKVKREGGHLWEGGKAKFVTPSGTQLRNVFRQLLQFLRRKSKTISHLDLSYARNNK